MFNFTCNRRICASSGYPEVSGTKNLERCQITVQNDALHSSYWRLREMSKKDSESLFGYFQLDNVDGERNFIVCVLLPNHLCWDDNACQ